MRKRVVVAMSGGVDSSVAASLLVDSGHEVIGLTMQTWPEGSGRSGGKQRGCCGFEAANDAFSVADSLGIPHYTLNFQEVFRKQVIKNFADEYLRGRTPNPCVKCNEQVKFNALLDKAIALGADALATGHYANVSHDGARYRLLKGKDSEKDQSYVLYPMKQDALAKTIFPLGGWTKHEVRAYAKERNLATAEKPESYDICFVPDGDYASFVKTAVETPIEEGTMVNRSGQVLGKHRGLLHYTIGQRRGLGLSSKNPLYVLEMKPETNTLVVGEESELYQNELHANEINWVSIDAPRSPIEVEAKIRYHAIASAATITPIANDKVKIAFRAPQKAITPGQSVVFYDGDAVLGGGIIE